jgi:hypothetical protein
VTGQWAVAVARIFTFRPDGLVRVVTVLRLFIFSVLTQ